MNFQELRRRLLGDGMNEQEVDDRLSEEAERENDEARDREVFDEIFGEKP